MPILAVITARGGSRRLPGKNIRSFAEKPLIAYSIQAAQNADYLVDRIIVSTDDPEIARISQEWGADVPFLRPQSLAAADTPSLPVVQHALAFAETEEKREFDHVLLLQPTSPLRTPQDIREAVSMCGPSTTAVISVTDATSCHPSKLRTVNNGVLQSYFDEKTNRKFDRESDKPLFKTNGAIYLTRRDALIDGQSLYGKAPRAYLMPPERSIDIDTELDFIVAEYLYRRVLDKQQHV